MPLQIDATVVYAWKREGEVLQRVLYKHLEVESPYNTYKKLGLPPTAICVPSKASWEAALVPEKTEYLYYVARKKANISLLKHTRIIWPTFERYRAKNNGKANTLLIVQLILSTNPAFIVLISWIVSEYDGISLYVQTTLKRNSIVLLPL